MNILQVNTSDFAGGAEKIAYCLHQIFRSIGNESFLAVGTRKSSDPYVYQIDNHSFRSKWAKRCISLAGMGFLQKPDSFALRMLRALIFGLGEPKRYLDVLLGHEDYHYPGTENLLQTAPARPDILHCHNLHNGYFDLRKLPCLNKEVPLVFTLHDAWLLSGHCAHSFSCERWKTGCGHCPDISIYPEIRRDGTAYNFRRKQHIFNQCHLNIATPSKWLMDKVQQSMLGPCMISSRIIPNGIPLDTFRPGDKSKVRRRLGIDLNVNVLLFTANGIRNNKWKDFETMRASINKLASSSHRRKILFLALGESAPPEKIGNALIQFLPFKTSQKEVAQYYQASDLYIHAAYEENYPLSILEALACGTPAVATSVGGIPEIIHNLNSVSICGTRDSYPLQSATGLLVPSGNADALAYGIETLLMEKNIREQLSQNAVVDAIKRFDIRKQAASYIEWYREILDRKCKR